MAHIEIRLGVIRIPGTHADADRGRAFGIALAKRQQHRYVEVMRPAAQRTETTPDTCKPRAEFAQEVIRRIVPARQACQGVALGAWSVDAPSGDGMRRQSIRQIDSAGRSQLCAKCDAVEPRASLGIALSRERKRADRRSVLERDQAQGSDGKAEAQHASAWRLDRLREERAA